MPEKTDFAFFGIRFIVRLLVCVYSNGCYAYFIIRFS